MTTLAEILALDDNCPGCPVCKPRPRSKGHPRGYPRGAPGGRRRGPARPARANGIPGRSGEAA